MQKFVWQFATFVLVVGLLSGCGKTDKEKMQGTWVMESVELQGKPLPAEFLKDTPKLIITGDTLYPAGKQDEEESTITLDSTKSPKTMDTTYTKGTKKGKTQKGIYTFEGDDTLKFAMPLSEKGDRPTEFKTKEGADVTVITLKREKAK